MKIAGMQRLASIDCEKTGVDVINLSISSLADKVSHLYFLQMDDIHSDIMNHIQSINKPFKITKANRTYGSGWGFYNNESLDDLYKSVNDEEFDWILYPDTDDLLPKNIIDILKEADDISAETIHFCYIECFGAVDQIIEVAKGFPIGPHHKAVKHREDITFMLSPGFNRAICNGKSLKGYETNYCMRHMRYVTSKGLEKRKSMNYIDQYFLQPHQTIPFKEGERFNYYARY